MDLQEQKAFFEDQGYLIIDHLLDSNELAECRHEIERLHQLAAEVDSREESRNNHFQREPFSGDQNSDGLPVLRKIENTRAFSELFSQLATHPKLVAAVQNLLGEDLLLFRSTLMLKL